MAGLGAALLWYQKKIGLYDQQLWERTVEKHILQNVDDLPKKTAKLKPELIDVDLVRGSAFPKAKPQHGWISNTSSGFLRVLFLPFYCSWWRQQTSYPVCFAILFLYFLQMAVLYFYFSAEESDFQNVSTSEIMTPVAMMSILGIVHSQIVATVSSKISHKGLRRSKRKRMKRIPRVVSSMCRDYNESKSFAETASDEKSDDKTKFETSKWENEAIRMTVLASANKIDNRKLIVTKNSDEESGLDSLDFAQTNETETLLNHNVIDSTRSNGVKDRLEMGHHLTLESKNENAKFDINAKTKNFEHDLSKSKLYGHNGTSQTFGMCQIKNNVLNDVRLEDLGDISSGDEYFVTRHKSHLFGIETQDNTKTPEHRRRGSLYSAKVRPGAERQMFPLYWRRFSDIEHKSSFNDDLRRFSDGNQFEQKSLAKEDIETKQLNHVVPIIVPTRVDPYSSCESEEDTTPTTPHKPTSSDVEWPIMTNTDCNSDSTDSPVTDHDDENVPSSFDDPVTADHQEASGHFYSPYSGSDKVSCAIWELNECKKVDLTVLDISSAIVVKVDSLSHSSEYLVVGLICALIIAILPPLFRLQNVALQEALQDVTSDVLLLAVPSPDEVVRFTEKLQETFLGNSNRSKLVILGALLGRFSLSAMYFFILAVAERTFKQRFLYAKHFSYLTSARRARRSDLPHFRLNKVRNIKTWLSVRSYLKKHGPQRSVDVVVSTAFVIIVCLLSFLCVQLLKESDQFVDRLYCWEVVFWCLALGLFLMRFMILGTKINKKYRNLSALTTEQINLYLHMEQKPHKKDELMLANNVLKLAIDLLKELESPFKISGLRANPYLYNITKVVVLSAFSAVLTELLGFKLKLHKIKIK